MLLQHVRLVPDSEVPTLMNWLAWRDQRDWAAEKYRRFDWQPDWKPPERPGGAILRNDTNGNILLDLTIHAPGIRLALVSAKLACPGHP